METKKDEQDYLSMQIEMLRRHNEAVIAENLHLRGLIRYMNEKKHEDEQQTS